jgi:hypothetical protein
MTIPVNIFNESFIENNKQFKAFSWLNIKSPKLIELFIKAVEFVDQGKHSDNVVLSQIAQQPINKEKQQEYAQFFTPPDVAIYTAIQLLNDYDNDMVIYDPSVGKGSLLIATANVLAMEYGITGIDLLKKLKGCEICSETYEQALENIYIGIQSWIEDIDKKKALSILKKNIRNSDFFDISIPKKSLLIANPPYKETKGIGNIWIKFVEKIISTSDVVAFGIIIPVSISSAVRTLELRKDIMAKYGEITAFHHDTRPRPLFRNVEQRITILHASKTKQSNKYYTTGFLTHKAKDRLSIWGNEYIELDYKLCDEVFPKLSKKEIDFFENNARSNFKLIDLLDPKKENYIWVRTTGRYKLQAQFDEPAELTSKWKKVYLNKSGARILKEIFENGKALKWWKIYGDGRDLSINRFLRGYGVDKWMKSKNYMHKHTKQKEMQDGKWQKMEKNQLQIVF